MALYVYCIPLHRHDNIEYMSICMHCLWSIPPSRATAHDERKNKYNINIPGPGQYINIFTYTHVCFCLISILNIYIPFAIHIRWTALSHWILNYTYICIYIMLNVHIRIQHMHASPGWMNGLIITIIIIYSAAVWYVIFFVSLHLGCISVYPAALYVLSLCLVRYNSISPSNKIHCRIAMSIESNERLTKNSRNQQSNTEIHFMRKWEKKMLPRSTLLIW